MQEENLFDNLTRLAASGMPRRRMIKLAMGSLAAAAFGRSAFATPTCSHGVLDASGHCCDSPRVLDKADNCCSPEHIDKAGYCCNSDGTRHLDPNGNCCANFDKYGYCKDEFPACAGATCETFTPCSSEDADCVCGSIAEGGGFCLPGSTPCDTLLTCDSTADCPSGSLCLVGSCCGTGVCAPLTLECPVSSSEKPKRSSASHGPTIAHR